MNFPRFVSRSRVLLPPPSELRVIKRVTGTYRYYLTRAGRAAIAAGRRLTEHTIIPCPGLTNLLTRCNHFDPKPLRFFADGAAKKFPRAGDRGFESFFLQQRESANFRSLRHSSIVTNFI